MSECFIKVGEVGLQDLLADRPALDRWFQGVSS